MFRKPYLILSSSSGICRDERYQILRFENEEAATEVALMFLETNPGSEFYVILDRRLAGPNDQPIPVRRG